MTIGPSQWGRALVVATLLALFSVPGSAFKGREHRSVANDGLRLAYAYAKANGILPEAELAKLATLLPDPARPNESYGDFVASVDYVLNPVELFEQYGQVQCLPGAIENLANRPGAGLPTRLLNQLRAAHNNEMHFGAEALNSFWAWHATVVDSAVRKGCTIQGGDALFGLVIANAVSEHYLEDLFAPGHVAAFRDTLHDIAAALIHERFNSRGAMFRLAKQAVLDDLLSLLGENEEHLDAIQDLKAEARKAAVEALKVQDGVYIFGDGGLDWVFETRGNSGETRIRTGAQRLLMTLLAARSILDVLDSYASGTPMNSFKSVCWEPQRVLDPYDSNKRRFHLALWEFAYGGYEPGWGVEGKRRLGREYVLYHGLGLGFSVEGQGFLKGSGSSTFRKIYRLEILPGLLAPGRSTDRQGTRVYQAKNFQIAGVLGYEYVNDPNHHGHGPAARVVVAVPKMDLMLSAVGGYRWLSQSRKESEGVFYGLRGELGFSLLTLYVAYHLSDNFIDLEGASREGSAVSFGVTLSMPSKKLIPGAAKLAGRKMYRE